MRGPLTLVFGGFSIESVLVLLDTCFGFSVYIRFPIRLIRMAPVGIDVSWCPTERWWCLGHHLRLHCMTELTTEGFEATDDTSTVRTVDPVEKVRRRGELRLEYVVSVDHLRLSEQNRVGRRSMRLKGQWVEHFGGDADDVADCNPIQDRNGDRVLVMRETIPFESTDRETITHALSVTGAIVDRMKAAVTEATWEGQQ